MVEKVARFESINPANGEHIGETLALDDEQLDRAVEQANQRAAAWATSTHADRRALLEALAQQLEEDREHLADLITLEMGKLIGESRAEIDKCARVCRYFAEHGEQFLADEGVDTEARRSLVAYQPLGVVLAVMPWNFPFWQVFRFAAPAVAAGNVGLLKHAANVMQCGAAIGETFDRAGAPPGLFTHVPLESARVARLIEDRRVRAVTLTGSEPAGRAVAERAGKVLKKCVLELGGSDPFIVLEDADLQKTVEKAVTSRFMNAGQSCIAAKRFILVESVADEFEQRLVAAVSELVQGDPTDIATTLAPMARDDLRRALHEQVQDAVSKGARLLAGGKPSSGPGFFFPGTIVSGVKPGMRAYKEELFGPAACILRAADEAHAIALANDTDFGLGGSVWTEDRVRGERIARRLDCGCAFVNELVKSDPRVPFGGIKSSGYGRELAYHGIREFVNTKTLWVD